MRAALLAAVAMLPLSVVVAWVMVRRDWEAECGDPDPLDAAAAIEAELDPWWQATLADVLLEAS